MKFNITKNYLYFTVFITGAVILILEILGTRIISPFYGSTIYVWSSLIAVTLVALAVGYFLGGWLADKIPKYSMIYYILSLTTLFILIIPVISKWVLKITNPLGASYGALVSSCILFAIPLVLLGMISPYAIKIRAHGLGNLGFTSGKLYGISTIGSCFGALLVTFYLIPNIDINSIIFIMGIVLCATASIFFLTRRRLIKSILVIIPLLMIIFAQPAQADILYETESAYSEIKVADLGTYRYLIVDGGAQTEYNLATKEFTFSYLDLYEEAVKQHPAPKDVLVIGLGGGGVDKKLKNYNLDIDSVEIDPEIAEIAEKYFDFKGNLIIDEGRHYIRNTGKKYDVIFLDAYNGHSIYPYILSKESFTEMKNILKTKEGIIALNLVGYVDSELFRSIYSTLKQVFDNVYVETTDEDFTNIILYATDKKLNLDLVDEKEGVIITDNYNPVESLAAKTSTDWRDMSHEIFKGNI